MRPILLIASLLAIVALASSQQRCFSPVKQAISESYECNHGPPYMYDPRGRVCSIIGMQSHCEDGMIFISDPECPKLGKCVPRCPYGPSSCIPRIFYYNRDSTYDYRGCRGGFREDRPRRVCLRMSYRYN